MTLDPAAGSVTEPGVGPGLTRRREGATMTHEQWLVLHEKVQASKGDEIATRALIVDLDERTIDGVTIALGLAVWDYDLRDTRVVGVQSVEVNGTVWFRTDNGGMFDGGRLWSHDYGIRQGWDREATR